MEKKVQAIIGKYVDLNGTYSKGFTLKWQKKVKILLIFKIAKM